MKRNAKKTVVVIALIALMAIPSMFAYFTDQTEKVTNTFTAGGVEITLTEPAWDGGTPEDDTDGGEAAAKNIVAGREIAKDPTVTNVGASPAYVFIELTEANANLYAWELKSGWTELKDGLYAYDTALAAKDGETVETAVLFDKVTIADDYDGNVNTFDIEAVAYGVQAEGFANAKAAWNATFGKSAPIQ